AALQRPAVDVATDRVRRVPGHDDDIDRPIALEVRLRAESTDRGVDLEAAGLEQLRQHVERLPVVVDDQRSRTSQRQGGAPYSRASVWAYATDAFARRACRARGLPPRRDHR